jgi:glycyl-tRNA synthetase beta chain
MSKQQINIEPSLLCEFLTEELPPINLEEFGKKFATNLFNELQSFSISTTLPSKFDYFITPRRFGCIIYNLRHKEEDKIILKKGPLIASGLKDNQPTQALLGFTKSCKLNSWNELIQGEDNYFYAQQQIIGRELSAVLPQAIEHSLKQLPIAKNMRWGKYNTQFVRPVHNLLLLFNDKLICNQQNIFNLLPVNYTYGHRVLAKDKLVITNTASFLNDLQHTGKVIANFQARKDEISQQIQTIASRLNLKVNINPALLDEVTALVEYPNVLLGEFDQEFLNIPQECLILSMAKNQKYFALTTSDGKLTNKFLFVANIVSAHPEIIIKGNQKVISARLSDAKFFYEVDLKNDLEYFISRLKPMIYHNKLGSQFDRVQRLQQISSNIIANAKTSTPIFNLEQKVVTTAANLLKADLTTEMVGEFPELQGTMGKYYAQAKAYPNDICLAIEEHYYPRFSGDQLPTAPLSILMALSEKIETIVGIWSIGLIPSGDKDQYALRRAAVGIIRILLNNHIDLNVLLSSSQIVFCQHFKANSDNINSTIVAVRKFILERLTNYLISIENYSTNCVQSVVNFKIDQPIYFDHLRSLLDMLQNFVQNNNNAALLQANKRIRNILEKNDISLSNQNATVDTTLFSTNEEQQLWQLYQANYQAIIVAGDNGNWQQFFSLLTVFNQPIETFFKNVMVMDNNLAIKTNRINLLSSLYVLFNYTCELSVLV